MSEPNREPDEQAHRVCVQDFELTKYEIRVADFSRFVDAQGYETDAERGVGRVTGCWAFDLGAKQGAWGYHPWASWREPRKSQDPDPNEPVTCVSKNDAEAYIRWLNQTTSQHFRLPTEAEWEYAARAATRTSPKRVHSPALHPLPRLEGERKSGAICNTYFVPCPKGW